MENLVAWVFAVGIMYTLLYAMHPTAERTEPLPQWFVCIWAGVCRACWSLGVAWVAFACSTGHGGKQTSGETNKKCRRNNVTKYVGKLNYCGILR